MTSSTVCATAVYFSRYLFTGKERDTESGNDYFPARYLASTTGRWLSPDPGWLAAADLANPQTLNAYSYVLNSPLNYDDPYGLWGCDDANTARPGTQSGLGKVIGAIGSFFRNVGCEIGNLDSNNSNSSTSGNGQSTTSGVTGSAGMEVVSVLLKFGANSQMPTSRDYSASDPFAANFRQSYEAGKIRKDIGNCSVSGRPTSGQGAGGVSTFRAGVRAPLDAASGSIAALQVGGFSYGFDRDGSTVHVHVVNDVTLDSLFYHIPSAYNSGFTGDPFMPMPSMPEQNSAGHFTTIHQSINYDEANPCN